MNTAKRIIAATTLATAMAMPVLAEDKAGWNTDVNAGISLTEGNSETLLGNAGIATKNVAGDIEKTAGAQVNYGESGPDTTTENAKAEAKIKKGLSDTLYGYLGGDLLYDDIAQVDHRLTVGPGLGVTLMKDDAATLAAEVGAVYIDEKVGGVSGDTVALRLAENYERKLSETSKVWQKAEYIPAFDDFGDYLLNAELGIEAAVSGKVNLRVVVQDRYDATPAAGLDENDLTVIAGLGYKL